MAGKQSKNAALLVLSLVLLAAAAFLIYRNLTSGSDTTPTASEQSANDALTKKLEDANKTKAPEVPAVPGGARARPAGK